MCLPLGSGKFHLAPGRVATPRDFDAALNTLCAAFDGDPVWGGWAFPDPSTAARRRRELFAIWLREALPLDSVLVVEDCAAVSLWYPPGSGDTEAYRLELRGFAANLGPHASVFLRGSELFATTQPDGRFWYLALLAVRLSERGRGLGMGLLRGCLGSPRIQNMPVYLESTHPANTPRYQKLGFADIGGFQLPGGPSVTRLWREAGSVTNI